MQRVVAPAESHQTNPLFRSAHFEDFDTQTIARPTQHNTTNPSLAHIYKYCEAQINGSLWFTVGSNRESSIRKLLSLSLTVTRAVLGSAMPRWPHSHFPAHRFPPKWQPPSCPLFSLFVLAEEKSHPWQIAIAKCFLLCNMQHTAVGLRFPAI